nr:hypothetical protein BaRGS_006500 [Batillaria attramentaria]
MLALSQQKRTRWSGDHTECSSGRTADLKTLQSPRSGVVILGEDREQGIAGLNFRFTNLAQDGLKKLEP